MRSLMFIWLLCGFVWGSAGQALDITPGNCGKIEEIADIWIKGDAAVKTDLPRWNVKDSFSGTILRVLSKGDRPEGFHAVYEFEVKREGEYAFHAALIHQGTPHASTVEYRFDSGDWEKIVPAKGSRTSWGVSNAINWESLGRQRLGTVKHTLEFRVRAKAANGFWSFMCDGIMAFDLGKQAEISGLRIESIPAPGTMADFSFNNSGNAVLGLAQLRMGDSLVSTKSFMIVPGINRLRFPLPELLGGNRYQLRISTIGDQSQPLAKLGFDIPAQPDYKPGLSIVQAAVEGTNYKIELKSPAAEAGRLSAMLFIEDKLYAVENVMVKPGQQMIAGKFSSSFLETARGRNALILFSGCPDKGYKRIAIEINPAGTVQPLPKPMNYGMFRDGDGLVHPWFIDREWRYIFDGQVYFPVGGMWCPATLINPSNDHNVIAKNLAHDLKTIKSLREYGIDDVYLNLSNPAPLWVRQAFLDMLEREKINYGYQLNGGGGCVIPSFFITRDREQSGGRWTGLVRGRYTGKRLEAELPKTYNIAGLLLVEEGSGGRERCHMLSFEDSEGKDVRHGIIDLETAADTSATRKIAVEAELPFEDGRQLIVIPLLNAKMHHVNFWDPEFRAREEKKLEWISHIRWGARMRCFIDPLRNETNMLNGTENLRQYTVHINNEFARWLEVRYGGIDELRRAWKADVADFNTASRLVPLRLEQRLLLLDPATGKAFPSDLKTSMAWLDYNDMIRETYAAHQDDLAMTIKSRVNVPVVIKSVGVAGSRINVSRKYLGFDGIGYEVYLNQGFPPEAGGGASRAQAEASTHTMWKVGTELGNSAQVGNDGVKFFKNAEDLRMMAREMSLSGVKGFYFFGIDLKPGNLWSKHNFHDFPEGMRWIQAVDQEYGKGDTKASPSSFCYPGGFCFWWWTTRWKALYDYEAIQIAQSVRLNGDEWGSNTDVLPDEFERVVINCPYPPFSLRHAPVIGKLIADGKQVIYLGGREDLGAIPGLDKYFTPEKINFSDGSSAQVLRSLPGTKVLARENGKIWALRSGNLVIVSRTPVVGTKYNRDQGFKYLGEVLRMDGQ